VPARFLPSKGVGIFPTIDQAFGYGRGVHNLLRAIHSDPKKWGKLASDPVALQREIQFLIDRGLFYLRYTTSDPAEFMRKKGLRVVADYVAHYADELSRLEFEPEKAFETLVEYGDQNGSALITGAIDIVRQDDPPRVTLIDFNWHGCPIHGQIPQTNREFWQRKLLRNKRRDSEVNRELRRQGWKTVRLWQHELCDSKKVVRKLSRSIQRSAPTALTATNRASSNRLERIRG
jgi:DNA mismatch endonuclease Vsr